MLNETLTQTYTFPVLDVVTALRLMLAMRSYHTPECGWSAWVNLSRSIETL